MNDDRLARLLNTSTPLAPTTDDEAAERIKAGAVRSTILEGEALDGKLGRATLSNTNPPTVEGRGSSSLKSASDDKQSIAERRAEIPKQPVRSRALRNHPASFKIPAEAREMLESISALGEEFTELAAKAPMAVGENTSKAHPGEIFGHDLSGEIEVAVDRLGRPLRLRLGGLWRQKTARDTFDDAVMKALNDAYLKLAKESFQGMPLQEIGLLRDTWTAGEAVPVAPLLDMDPTAVLRQTDLLLEEFSTALAKLERDMHGEAPAEKTFKSQHRRVTLTVAGGMVTKVTTQRSWIESADSTRICAEFANAFASLPHQPVGFPSDQAEDAVLDEISKPLTELNALVDRLGFGKERRI